MSASVAWHGSTVTWNWYFYSGITTDAPWASTPAPSLVTTSSIAQDPISTFGVTRLFDSRVSCYENAYLFSLPPVPDGAAAVRTFDLSHVGSTGRIVME